MLGSQQPPPRASLSSLPSKPEALEYRGPSLGGYDQSQVTPVSHTLGVAGPQRELVIREIYRLQRSFGQQKRQKLALSTAVVSLAILGVSVWTLIEAVYALTATDQHTHLEQFIFAIVEIAGWALSLLAVTCILFYLRARKPTFATALALALASITVFIHVALAILNFILIAVWRSDVHQACEDWKVDVVWLDKDRICTRSRTSLDGYLIAAGIRLLVVFIISALWLALLRMFALSLTPTLTDNVESQLLEATEMQDILKRHDAALVDLASGTVHQYSGPGDQSSLPPMPEHRRLLSEGSVVEPNAQQSPQKAGWLWGTVSWMFGVSDPSRLEPEPALSSDEQQKPQQSSQAQDWRFGTLGSADSHEVSKSYRGAPAASRYRQNSLHPDYQEEKLTPPAATSDDRSRSATPGSAFARLFGFGGSSSASGSGASTPTPDDAESNETVQQQHHSRADEEEAVKTPLVSTFEEQEQQRHAARHASGMSNSTSRSWVSYDGSSMSEDADQDRSSIDRPASATLSQHGAQRDGRDQHVPYNQRQMVYVEMGDGRLVHRLSTIGEGDRSTLRTASSNLSGLLSSSTSTPLTEIDAQLPGGLPAGELR